jgi:hypothetical protein
MFHEEHNEENLHQRMRLVLDVGCSACGASLPLCDSRLWGYEPREAGEGFRRSTGPRRCIGISWVGVVAFQSANLVAVKF